MALPSRASIAAVCLLLSHAAVAQPPDTATILAELGFPGDTIARVQAGQMVHTDLRSSNEREIGVGLAFLVTVPPPKLAEEVRDGLLTQVDPDVQAHGTLDGDGSVSDLAGVDLAGLAQAYADAKPGASLNLSTAEIRALQALKGQPTAALEAEVRRQLLERYRAYRGAGLGGIAPYDRGGEQRAAAADLRSATEAVGIVKSQAPHFYDTLLHYPKHPDGDFEEVFRWQRYQAHGEPVFILVHVFTVGSADAFAAAQRQYYVSGGFNVEQAIAGFLPVSEGTLVVYQNRTSTDQVEGFGGGTKRSLGERVMASQLEALFAKFQRAADR